MNEAGYSLREISSLLGYKSSRSAAVLISKAKKVRHCGDGTNPSNES